MNSAFTLTLLLSLLIATVYCNHEHNHHNNHGDDKWITFVSQIESFWKTETPGKSSETHTESTLNNKDVVYSSEKTSEDGVRKSDTRNEFTSRTSDDIRQSVRLGLAAALGITAVGVSIMICCCCCIFNRGCGMCRNRQDGHVVVMNTNTVHQPPIPQPSQVIVQPPMYQQVSPPQNIGHQYSPPPPYMPYGQQQFQQHGGKEFQQQMAPPQYCEFSDGGFENPTFDNPSAPPRSPEKY